MSAHLDEATPGLLAPGSPVRLALLVLLAYAALGAVAGAVWEWVWTPPGQVVHDHQVFYDSYASLRRVFTGTGLYVIVGGAASAVIALVVTLLTRRRELLTLVLVLVGSVIAAWLMGVVGTALGPSGSASVAAHSANGTKVLGELTVTDTSPYLVWPLTSLFVLAVVFFAWPGSHAGGRHGDRGAAHRAEADPTEAWRR